MHGRAWQAGAGWLVSGGHMSVVLASKGGQIERWWKQNVGARGAGIWRRQCGEEQGVMVTKMGQWRQGIWCINRYSKLVVLELVAQRRASCGFVQLLFVFTVHKMVGWYTKDTSSHDSFLSSTPSHHYKGNKSKWGRGEAYLLRAQKVLIIFYGVNMRCILWGDRCARQTDGQRKVDGSTQASRHNHGQQGHQGEHAFIYLIQNNTFNCLWYSMFCEHQGSTKETIDMSCNKVQHVWGRYITDKAKKNRWLQTALLLAWSYFVGFITRNHKLISVDVSWYEWHEVFTVTY